MSAWKVILATLVIFTTGLITGGLMVKKFSSSKPPPLVSQPQESMTPAEPWLMRNALLFQMQRELNLTPDQHARIQKILEESRENWRVLWEIMGPEVQSELRHVREAITEELEPNQRERFERLLQERPRRQKEMPPRDGNQPGPFRGPRPPDGFPPRPGDGQPYGPNNPPRPKPFDRPPGNPPSAGITAGSEPAPRP